MAWHLRIGNRPGVVAALAAAAVGLVGFIAAGPVLVVDEQKAAKVLVQQAGLDRHDRDIRLYALDYFQESLVFYSGRRVEKIFDPLKVDGVLASPLPVYLFVPEPTWESIRGSVTTPHSVVARKYDFYRNAVILVVANNR